VLSYLFGDESTLLFVLTRGPDAQSLATLNVHRIERTGAELTQNVREFLLRFATKGGRYSGYARELYQWLLAPAEPELTGKTHLVIIPDGVLHALPFQALLDEQDRHLIERYAVSYTPSATALEAMLHQADRSRETASPPLLLLAMGNPTFPPGIEALPATENEVQEIGKLFGPLSRVLTGPDASEAAAKAELGKARYVHLATHGWLNDASPLYSAVVLAKGPNDDGWLHAQELLDLELRAELVTLSACQTALGQEVSGEGILGLTWALFVAGTPSSIVTQWQVADQSTSKLMQAFYRQLRPASANPLAAISKAEALRQAQLHLMRDGQHAHPYYWAPFVLVGGW
jgi:CHAT domain-containing protein